MNRIPLVALAAPATLVGAIVLGACGTGSPASPGWPDDADVPEAGTKLQSSPDANIDPSECAGPPTLTAIQTDIFSASCAFGSCHGGANAAAGLDLSPGNACNSLVNVTSCEFTSGTMLVVPGDPDSSYLYRKVAGQNLGSNPDGTCAAITNGTPLRMPLGSAPLCQGQIDQIRDWIQAGALCTEDDGGVSPDGGPSLEAGSTTGVDAGPSPDAGSTTVIDAGEPTVADVASTGALTVGAQIDGTVTLQAPAPAPVAVLLSSSAPTVVAVPSAVLVAAGQSTATFTMQGISSGSAAIQAVTVGNPVSMNVDVGGVAPPPPPTAFPTLVELYYDDTQFSDGEQWIRLYNATSETIDLSQFSVGAGQTSYTETTASLAGTLAPGGCAVIGGPTSNIFNGDPVYSQVIHFLPNFAASGGANGAGVALFNVPAASITASTVPVSAVVYGESNAAGLLGSDGNPATPVPDVALAEDSLLLQSGTWIDNPSPTPSSCP